MKRILQFSLAVLLVLGSAPAWSMQMGCARTGSASLACVRLCAHSAALLTQGGKLAGLGHADCSVSAHQSDDSLSVAQAKAPQAMDAPALALVPVFTAAPAASSLALDLRGPPWPSLFLFSEHPSAKAPPTLF